MHRKSDALDKFIKFKVELENQLGKHIKKLWFDQGGEHKSTQFDPFIKRMRTYHSWVHLELHSRME